MAYCSAAPIPLNKENGQPKGPPERNFQRTAQRPLKSQKDTSSAYDRRDKTGRGNARPNSKPPGMNDPYGIDIAPLNIFENQVVPVGVHNLSKSFKPNMATIRVLSFHVKNTSKKYLLIYCLQYEFMFPQNPKDKKPS